MFKKRRSMLGRRHLTQQAVQTRPVLSQDTNIGDNRDGRGNNSWRGRSGKKKTPNKYDNTSKDFKKCLFSKSPGFNLTGDYRLHGQEQTSYSSNEDLWDETGIISIVPTPKTTPGLVITPATLQNRRVQLESARYGPLSSTANRATLKLTASSSSAQPKQSSYICDLDDLKPPDSPGPSRLERILLEEKLSQTSTGIDFDNLEPPKSPDCSRLDRLIMKEKLEQPLDPDLEKNECLSLIDPNPRLPFSPPLSSTCIGSPDSGKKNPTVTEEIKETVLRSGRKLSTIKEDCDVSIIEFELNERTITESDYSLMDTTINNTVKPNHVMTLDNIPEDEVINQESDPCRKINDMLSHLNDMEEAVMNRTVAAIQNIQNQYENIKREIQNNCQKDVSNIRSMKKMLESLNYASIAGQSNENKENSFKFKVPTVKKKQIDQESKWFNSVKKENPGLLKTPNAIRKVRQSSTLTPHSLSKVLCDQMSELYED